MDTETTDIVWMSFKLGDFFARVEVETPQLKIVTPAYEPILPRDEFASPDRNIRDFECFDYGGRLVVVKKNLPIVHRSQDPWLRGVKVNLQVSQSFHVVCLTALTRSLLARCIRWIFSLRIDERD